MNKVLIVEDEPIIQKGLQYKMNWLQLNCVVVGCADNGDMGKEMIDKLKPDIVITDIRMPFKDGIEMLKETVENNKFEAIILTGYDEFNYAKQAIRLGVHDYLLKPVDMEELAEVIKDLIFKIEEKKAKDNYKVNSLLYKELLNINLNVAETSSYVIDTIDFIKKNYATKINFKDLCDNLGVSNVFLSAKFKSETNYSLNDFLNRYRLLKAVELLQNDKVLVYEVAEEVGFSEYKYFSQVFKKYIGMPPKQFLHQEF
ncbi:response regulator transcription factor [Oceanobacillus sojae]|uniref:response regulator transcription factor n=1 Tax=Oceanobacillus sojae TaxID=582851 RepID=UPI00098877BB|nr:response regulator [Oceanobacillus sojae]MCT1902462.1 response regulator [Oceanobacillus sojae]